MKIKYFKIFITIILISCNPVFSFSSIKDLESNAERIANAFNSEVKKSDFEHTKLLKLTWTAHMKTRFGIRLIMDAILKMEEEENGYSVTFKITKPKGKNVWSKFMLNFFGKHTKAYKELLNAIEIIVFEHFRIDNGCIRTDKIEEFLPGKKQYRNQTALKVEFEHDKKQIKFWKDKRKQEFSKMITYSGQVGPFTAFFNYMFFLPTETDILIINAIKQIPDPTPNDIKFNRRIVNYRFDSEVLHLGQNNTGLKREYLMTISMDKGNLFDTIYGENVFFQMSVNKEGLVKMPYLIRLEGMIDKAKKMKKLKKLKKKYPDRIISEKDVLKDANDILVVKNVRMFLTDYSFVKNK